MITLDVYDHQKNVAESIGLDESVFSVPVNEAFLHQVLVSYRSNARQGTAKTKNRNEVRGSKQKPYRQKGTGRARQGTLYAAQHRGGAAQFGPRPRSYRKTISKKMKREAFRQCLSCKIQNGTLFILEDLDFDEVKTKQAAQILDAFETDGQTLFVDVDPTKNALLSIRNLKDVRIKSTNSCSPLDLFESEVLFFTKAAVEAYQQRFAKAGGTSQDE